MAAGVKYYNCKKIGNLAKICASYIFGNPSSQTKPAKMKQQANLIKQGENNSSDNKLDTGHANAIIRRINNASPVYRILLSQVGMCTFQVESPPDIGCTVSLLNLQIAQRNGIQIDWTRNIQLYRAAGGCMQVKGMARINVSAHKPHWTWPSATIRKKICCNDLRKLHIIPT